MDVEPLIDALEAEGHRLAAAVEGASLESPVPSCPGWHLRELLAHTGLVHRWATSVVAEALLTPPPLAAGDSVLAGAPPDDELLGWFVDGHRRLVTTLRSAPDSLEAWAFLPAPSPRAFWARRQAHETALHRADAQLSTGSRARFDPDFATDGIDELLMGFTPTKRSRVRLAEPRTLRVRCSDTGASWLVTYGPQRVETNRGDGPADATAVGPASDLYLFLWNRPPSASPTVSGDHALLDLWPANLAV